LCVTTPPYKPARNQNNENQKKEKIGKMRIVEQTYFLKVHNWVQITTPNYYVDFQGGRRTGTSVLMFTLPWRRGKEPIIPVEVKIDKKCCENFGRQK
jgi:hypothetical protein